MTVDPDSIRRAFERKINPNRLHRLFAESGRPIVAIRVRHPSWRVPHGKLARFSIPAAQKLTRRSLDSLLRPKLMAAGVFKVVTGPAYYQIELHLIVAGASAATLERTFYDTEPAKVTTLRQAIHHFLIGTVQKPAGLGGWETVRLHAELDPSCEQWPEYVGWLRQHFRRLVFRYGCDRYWNRLNKPPRQVRSKAAKKHPYPYWLERFWFGGDWQEFNEVLRKIR
jgi:hypothetical protein